MTAPWQVTFFISLLRKASCANAAFHAFANAVVEWADSPSSYQESAYPLLDAFKDLGQNMVSEGQEANIKDVIKQNLRNRRSTEAPSDDLPESPQIPKKTSEKEVTYVLSDLPCSCELSKDSINIILPPDHGSNVAHPMHTRTTVAGSPHTVKPPIELSYQQLRQILSRNPDIRIVLQRVPKHSDDVLTSDTAVSNTRVFKRSSFVDARGTIQPEKVEKYAPPAFLTR